MRSGLRRAGAAMACSAAAGAAVAVGVCPPPAGAAQPPRLDVRAAALIDAGSGQRLYGLNASSEVAIASATKIMTALVALEHSRLTRVLTAPPYELAAVDSQIGLRAGEPMTVRDLVIAMMLPSADDAAHDLAYHLGAGSVDRFVAMMNARARALGLTHTHYSTPVGLDTPGNFSSADDLVALARYALRTQPFLRRVVAMPRAQIRVGTQMRTVTNLNGLVGRVPWIDGVKTGHTLDAGYVLVGSGARDGMALVGAVLGASSEAARESDTLALLRWGFENFRPVSPVTSGEVVTRLPVRGRAGLVVPLLAAGSFRRVIPRSVSVRTVVQAPRRLRGPRRKGTVAGSVVVMLDARPTARIPLRLARAVPAPPVGFTPTTLLGPFTLVVIVLLLGVAVIRGRRERLTARRAAAHRQE